MPLDQPTIAEHSRDRFPHALRDPMRAVRAAKDALDTAWFDLVDACAHVSRSAGAEGFHAALVLDDTTRNLLQIEPCKGTRLTQEQTSGAVHCATKEWNTRFTRYNFSWIYEDPARNRCVDLRTPTDVLGARLALFGELGARHFGDSYLTSVENSMEQQYRFLLGNRTPLLIRLRDHIRGYDRPAKLCTALMYRRILEEPTEDCGAIRSVIDRLQTIPRMDSAKAEDIAKAALRDARDAIFSCRMLAAPDFFAEELAALRSRDVILDATTNHLSCWN